LKAAASAGCTTMLGHERRDLNVCHIE